MSAAPFPLSLAEAEQRLQSLKYEEAYCYSERGECLFSKSGSRNKITFEDDELALIENFVFVHNHPSNFSFSRQDVVFISAFNPAQARIITPSRRIVLNRPTDGWPDEFEEAWNEAFQVTYERRVNSYRWGIMSERQFSRYVYRRTMRRVARDLQMDYTETDL